MKAAGRAFDDVSTHAPTSSDAGNRGQTDTAVEVTNPGSVPLPSSSSGSSSSSDGSGASGENQVLSLARCTWEDCQAILGLTCEPVVELWRDHRAWHQTQYPRADLEKGRQKELDNIRDFGAAEEVTKSDADALAKRTGEATPDMRWVDGWRGDEVRARLVVRQFNQSKRHDIFSGTPDAWFMRFQINRC